VFEVLLDKSSDCCVWQPGELYKTLISFVNSLQESKFEGQRYNEVGEMEME
jgi:hypothetical protein